MCGLPCVCPIENIVRSTAIAAHGPPITRDLGLAIGKLELAPVTCVLQRTRANAVRVEGEMRLDGRLEGSLAQVDVLWTIRCAGDERSGGVDNYRALPCLIVGLPPTRLAELPTALHLIPSVVVRIHGHRVRSLIVELQAADSSFLEAISAAGDGPLCDGDN